MASGIFAEGRISRNDSVVAKAMRVLAIVPYHLDFCAGQRFRIELWAKELVDRGIETEFLPYTNPRLTDTLYRSTGTIKKGLLSLSALLRQISIAIKTRKPDLIFIYREAAVVGPPVIEKMVRKWGIPIVYDIDEPLFVPYVSPSNGRMNRLKFFSKYDYLLAMSDCVFAVNRAIADHAAELNSNVAVVPMAVDMERYRPIIGKKLNEKPIIAWVGTRTNQPNIEAIVPTLRRLAKDKEFTFRIIADDPMDFDGLDVEFIPWTYGGEVRALQEADIGVTPVGESPWAKWKFFFKTVQFMSTGLPVVAANIGSNIEVIKDGVNGYIANSEGDWYEKLDRLLADRKLRDGLGEEARQTVASRFDIDKQIDFVEEKFKSFRRK
jgi:glycosyltransferase involved in cell wall biosynthesis